MQITLNFILESFNFGSFEITYPFLFFYFQKYVKNCQFHQYLSRKGREMYTKFRTNEGYRQV